LHSSRFLSSCCSFCFCSVDSNLPRCAAFYENSIGCRCSCSCRNETTATKAEKATSALAETAKQNDVSAYLVKIVAFHCLPFQLCATRRIHNVVMKWAHGTHTHSHSPRINILASNPARGPNWAKSCRFSPLFGPPSGLSVI